MSSADRRAEEIIHRELERARPDYGFLMEESGEIKGADPTSRWIIDPLDGTTNFLHGIPHFAVSIALERNGVLQAGVVLNPVTQELYTAERGGGAYLNDRRLRVAARKNLADSIIGTGIPFAGKSNHARYIQQLYRFMVSTAGVRRPGAIALDLAYIAAGRFDGFWEEEVNSWDMAAGILLIREAGGTATDIDGGDRMFATGSVVAGNETIHQLVLEQLKKAQAKSK